MSRSGSTGESEQLDRWGKLDSSRRDLVLKHTEPHEARGAGHWATHVPLPGQSEVIAPCGDRWKSIAPCEDHTKGIFGRHGSLEKVLLCKHS